MVVRVPHDVDALPRPMSEEFAALIAAPDGIGPRPIHLATVDDPLGGALGSRASDTAYMVVEHVPGHPRPAAGWTDDLLAAHAAQLARLHEVTFDGHGDVSATDRLEPRLSILDAAEASLQWWTDHHPDLVAAPDITALWPRVRALFSDIEPVFARLERFSLTHGDAALTNILVSGGTPRYVDWEWSHIGDPARDLAFIGGEVWLEPWYLRLGRARIEAFLEAYVEAGGQGEVAALAARGRCWLVHEVFFVALHLRRRAQQGDDLSDAARADTLLARLRPALG